MVGALVLVSAGDGRSPETRIAAPPHPRPIVWGVADNLHRDDASILRKLSVMKDVGVQMVRLDIGFRPSDLRAVRLARDDGLEVLGVVYGPREPAAYADYAERIVRTYSALGVHHFEIWNEPNVRYFWPTADDPERAVAEYMALVRAAYPRMKAADPGSTILVGALSRREDVGGRPNDWVAAMYEDGLKGNFDALSVHPYTYPARPGDESTAANAWREVAGPWADRTLSVRELMVANGDGAKTVWITEFAAPTARTKGAVTEQRQAEIAHSALALAETYPWLGGFFWYGIKDAPTGVETYGLLRSDWTPKPSFFVYRDAIRATAGRPAGSGVLG